VAIIGKFLLRFAIAVLIAMENNLNPLGMQRLDLIKNDNHATIISRIGDVERNNV
jgi:hypothetical protein